MANRDQFEKLIKEKLEQNGNPDTEEAWESFAPLLTPSKIPFWKHWLMPYLYSSMLFLVFLGWQLWDRGPKGNALISPEIKTSVGDTRYRRDTILRIDTIFLVQKVYVRESPLLRSQEGFGEASNRGLESENALRIPTESSVSIPNLDQPVMSTDSSTRSGSFQSENTTHSLSRTSASPESPYVDQMSIVQEAKVVNSSTIQVETSFRRRSMPAPSIAPKENVILRSEEEVVIGDTSKVLQSSDKQRSKPMFHVEASTSLLFPVSSRIDYSIRGHQGFHLGMEWESGWGVYFGAIGNQTKGELDDDETVTLNPGLIQSLPNVPTDITAVDEIYLTNRQWYFPLELRWRSLYYNGFSFESSVGLMGNYLSRQDFTYELEEDLLFEYEYGTSSPQTFTISHLRVGLGTNYLISRRWGTFLRSHYWLPLSRTGLLRDRVHGLEIGMGVNFFIGK